MRMQPLNEENTARWSELFTDYFVTALAMPLTAEQVRDRLCPFLLDQWRRGVLRIDLAFEEEAAAGFSIYQVDTPESDWCKRPGWGFVREFYIAPPHQRRGLGSQLAEHTARALGEMGARDIYLTSDAAVDFWRQRGYQVESGPDAEGMFTLVRHLNETISDDQDKGETHHAS